MVQYQEQELARRCAKGDSRARKELYTLYSARLYGLCLRYCTDAEKARDLLHDSFIKVYDKIGRFQYRGEGSLYSWMARLTIGICVDEIRRRSRINFVDLDEGPDISDEPSADIVSKIPGHKIRELIDKLPPVRRTVFNLHYIDGLSHKDIAEMLGIQEKSSTSMAAKARSSLALMIKDYIDRQDE